MFAAILFFWGVICFDLKLLSLTIRLNPAPFGILARDPSNLAESGRSFSHSQPAFCILNSQAGGYLIGAGFVAHSKGVAPQLAELKLQNQTYLANRQTAA